MRKTVLSFAIVFISTQLFSQLTVIETIPTAQSFIPVDEGITIYFSDILDGTTVNQNSVQVFGRWSGPMTGEILISGVGNAFYFAPDDDLINGEWVTVTLSNSIQSINGDFLENGFQYNFWTSTLEGSMLLADPLIIEMRLAGEGLLQCYGAYAGDINNDEYSDLIVVNENANDVRILLNDELNGFTDFTVLPLTTSNKPSTNEGADFNGDGLIDIAIGSTQSNAVSLLYGNGTSLDSENSLSADQGVRGLTVLDFNGDGWADIATANRDAGNIALIQNDGVGGFEDAYFLDLLCDGETAISAADMNEDGLLDLIVGCRTSSVVTILLNEGNGVFNEGVSQNSGSLPWMVGVGDLTGNGRVDVVSSNSGDNTMSVFIGGGNGQIGPAISYPTGIFPLAIDLGDLDGDGDLDIITSNFLSADFTVFENDGNGLFNTSYTLDADQAGSCAIFHDHNNDGLLDLTCVDELSDLLFIYTNSTPNGIEEIRSSFELFPNPTSGTVYVKGLLANEYLGLIDLNGKRITQINSNGMHDLGNLSPGHYLIESSLKRTSKKLIIE